MRSFFSVLLSTLLALAMLSPAIAAAEPTSSSGAARSGDAATSITGAIAQNGVTGTPVYDTAWEMPVAATFAELEAYFDHLYRTGFAGTWVSFFDLMQANLYQTTPEGDLVATINNQGQFEITAGYIGRFTKILDMAHARGLTVSIAPAWAAVYANGRIQGCSAAGSGPLFEWNAFNLGWQLGQHFGQHPAVGQWIMGGDNFCGVENPAIWSQLAAGLADRGANQPTTYHSPAIPSRHYDNLSADWLDFAAPQTGHCQYADATKSQLQAVQSATNKPVIAGELRYEGIQPTWDCSGVHGPGRPVSAEDVRQDVRAALDSGVNAILFGHNERWQWGVGVHGSSGRGGQGAIESLGSQGEQIVLQQAGASPRNGTSGEDTSSNENKIRRAEQRVQNARQTVANVEARIASINKNRRKAKADVDASEKALAKAKRVNNKATGAKNKKAAAATLEKARKQLKNDNANLDRIKARLKNVEATLTRVQATLQRALATLRTVRGY